MYSINRLISLYKKGDKQMRDILLQKYEGRINSIAQELQGLGLEDEDLLQEAYLGFLEAFDELAKSESQNPHRKIRQRIEIHPKRAVASQNMSYDWDDQHDRKIGEKLVAILKAKRDLLLTLGREPSIEEISLHSGFSTGNVKSIIELQNRRATNIEGMTIEDLSEVLDGVSDVEIDLLYENDKARLVAMVMDKLDDILSPSEHQVLECYKRGIFKLGGLISELGTTYQNMDGTKKRIAIKARKALKEVLEEMYVEEQMRHSVDEEKRLINKERRKNLYNRDRY